MSGVQTDPYFAMDYIVLLLVCFPPVVQCFSSGNVTLSCEDMRPKHSDLSTQTGPSPFIVTTDKSSFQLGEHITVHLQAQGSTPFIGFLLQAREVGSNSTVGSFSLTTGDAQLLVCSQKPSSAVSHNSSAAKTSVQMTWWSEETSKPIEFHATFVQNYSIFWVDVKSITLPFINESINGSTIAPYTPTTNSSNTTPPTTNTTIQPAPLPIISSADCGVTKVCFSQPSKCDPSISADCYFMSVMMSPSDESIHYELTGPSDGYISFGFSDDQMMIAHNHISEEAHDTQGNDDIYICGIGSNGLVGLQRAFSIGQMAPQSVPLGNVSQLRVSAQDRVISCSFISMNTISTQRTTGLNKTYYLMFARGPSNNGQIKFHDVTFISTNKIDISRPQTIRQAGLPHIIKAHGALMLISWMSMGSLGMMVARYLKGMAKGHNLWGKDVWFLVHASVMSVTTAATIIAFILSFSYVRGWSQGAHSVLGCLVMILSFFQPIMALLRCGPEHPLRFLFNWSHALNGVLIKALAVAAIFTGLKIIDSTPDQWLMKVMGGFLGWEAVFYLLLDVHSKWKVNSADTLESKMVTIDVLLMAVFIVGNFAFLVALLVGIGKS